MEICPICNGTGVVTRDGIENCECDCSYGVIFEGDETHWNPWKKQEMADEFLKKSKNTREDFIKDYPELAREMMFDGGF